MTMYQYDREDLERICAAYVLHIVNEDYLERACEEHVYRDLHGNGFLHVVWSVGGPRAELYGDHARGLVVVSFGRSTVSQYVPGDSWGQYWEKCGPLLDWPIG
jgi:hypothetical protein